MFFELVATGGEATTTSALAGPHAVVQQSVGLKGLLLHRFPAQSTGGAGQAGGGWADTIFDAGVEVEVEAGAWAPAKAGTRIASDRPQRNRRDRCEDSLCMNSSS
jgi:hypothetical protein